MMAAISKRERLLPFPGQDNTEKIPARNGRVILAGRECRNLLPMNITRTKAQPNMDGQHVMVGSSHSNVK
ncbi:hypothetical protein CBM2598_U30022 [Cupriavidus taiwanensis]|uniref:Uncharacterized protein n=1 Tax=Cupriavidus taiwanensis TaxID=164546 RepID=A0A7Z7JHX8_9BURK|nr:hypothetical protein CBM2597_U30022 [Cupriavidus taiwanensis]SOZ96963.1 hypothetical protein CBM2598_U30022 [Cupriavidus taiwanensis]SPC25958.1 hypothetical protein CBM2594_U20145 [Cupriavidus taiwanensis]